MRTSSRDSLLVWELAGIPFIVTIGSALHFAFEWSGLWTPLALFAAVNESTWEHLKLAFWPGLFWAILECRRNDVDQDLFWAAKGYGLLIPPIVIVTVFSSYTAILEYNPTFAIWIANRTHYSAFAIWMLDRRH